MKDIERNKILARFLGYEYTGWNEVNNTNKFIGWSKPAKTRFQELLTHKGIGFLCRSNNDLPFDSDWNWIMKVIDKLEKDNYLIEISTKNLVIKKSYDFYMPNKLIAFHTFRDNKLQLVFETLADLIVEQKL